MPRNIQSGQAILFKLSDFKKKKKKNIHLPRTSKHIPFAHLQKSFDAKTAVARLAQARLMSARKEKIDATKAQNCLKPVSSYESMRAKRKLQL